MIRERSLLRVTREMSCLYKIDKTLVDNMNLNRSCLVIMPKVTVRREEKALERALSLEDADKLPPEVRELAEKYLDDAGENARQILYNARVDAEQIREEARREGNAQGLEQGRQEAAAELEAGNERVRDVLTRVEAYRRELYDMLEADVLSLSMEVARKIIDIHLEKDDRVFRDIVKKAVGSVHHADRFSLYVSKDDYERYFKDGAQWLRDETQRGAVEVFADANLPGGSCIVEADSEIVDAGIPMQLGKISQYLDERVE